MTDKYFVAHGPHDTPEQGLCAMEWVSYLAGERHSDRPECVDSVLRKYCMGLNDALYDRQRQRLRPYLARCIGTMGDGRHMERHKLLRQLTEALNINATATPHGIAGYLARYDIDFAFEILEAMLPLEVIQMPVVEDAELVCGVPVR